MRTLPAILLALAPLPAGVCAADSFSPEQLHHFETTVRPLLAQHCYDCHGPKKQNNGLRLDSRAAILKGSDYGSIVEPGNPDASKLIHAVRHAEGVEPMPKKADPLPEAAIAVLADWIREGLPWPDEAAPAAAIEEWRTHWAFQPVQRPVPPPAADPAQILQPLDAFISAKLSAKGLAFSPPADRATLIRRAALDLTGLPPTSDEVREFVSDPDPDAFTRLVDRLLARPQFGERWARHWMDIARYADTKGYVFQEERRYPYAWTYRDWLISAFNDDVPYDRFLTLQIAGDQAAAPDKPQDQAAMGFLTLGRRFLNSQPDIIDDRLDVVFRGTQALTVGCARCHDHKFDPIPTADYYSLYGVFASSEEPGDLPLIGPQEQTPEFLAYQQKLQEKEAAVENYRQERLHYPYTEDGVRKYLTTLPEILTTPDGEWKDATTSRNLYPPVAARWRDWLRRQGEDSPVFALYHLLARLPAATFSADASAVLGTPGVEEICDPAVLREFRQAALPDFPAAAAVYARLITTGEAPDLAAARTALTDPDGIRGVPENEIDRSFFRNEREHLRDLTAKVEKFKATNPSAPPRAMVMVDRAQPVEPVIFQRGNAGRPGPKVPRQFLKALSADNRQPFTRGSGRMELAEKIASRDNPLTARVFVNRVWALLLGAPLVDSPSDFGVRTLPPANPELLDSLAAQFMDEGWSVKKLIRTILLSRTWQQSSLTNPAGLAADPENRLQWRQNRRRLDFEALRDSVLAACGTLDLTLGGRSIDILTEPWSPRRSLYGFIDRQNLPGTFRTFDLATPDTTSPRRFETTVPQQALFMMNSPFVLAQARQLSATLPRGDRAERVRILYRRILSREPEAAEITAALACIDDLARQPMQSGTRWEYGCGTLDPASGQVQFTPFPDYRNGRWAGGPEIPGNPSGWSQLTPDGGHPGDAAHAAIRRWTAPEAVTLTITGTLRLPSANSTGIRAVLCTSARGVIASWDLAAGATIETAVPGVTLAAGESVSFFVDCAGDTNSDSFTWSPVITDTATGQLVASATADFSGPGTTAWQALTQVILCTNEFLYLD